MNFGDRVFIHRTDVLGIPLRAAAKQIGISTATLSRIENGRVPDIFTFAKLCKWVGVGAEHALDEIVK